MHRTVQTSPRRWARLAGAFYLVTIIMGVFAEVFVRHALIVRNDAAATATNILAHEPLYRSGLAADLIMIACYIAVTLLLYDLLKPVGRSLSLLAAFFSLVGTAILAVNTLNQVAPLVFLGSAHYLRAFETTQLQALALMSLGMHARGYSISGMFFGPYMLLLGYLIFRSHFLPRILGLLMAMGGASNVIDGFTTILLPTLSARLPDLGMLGGIAELSLALWLLAIGVNVQRWTEEASAPSP